MVDFNVTNFITIALIVIFAAIILRVGMKMIGRSSPI